jgi:hypothetical protein
MTGFAWLTGGGTITNNPGGSSGQIQYNNSGSFGAFTLGGDATVDVTTGLLTIGSIGGKTVSLGGALTTANAFTTAGNFALTLTATADTNVTLPTIGTLATLAGSETLSNKTLVAPALGAATATSLAIGGATLGGNALAVTGSVAISTTVATGAPAGSTAGLWKLGAANTVSPTSPNRTIAIDIGGTVYYLAAKTTND